MKNLVDFINEKKEVNKIGDLFTISEILSSGTGSNQSFIDLFDDKDTDFSKLSSIEQMEMNMGRGYLDTEKVKKESKRSKFSGMAKEFVDSKYYGYFEKGNLGKGFAELVEIILDIPYNLDFNYYSKNEKNIRTTLRNLMNKEVDTHSGAGIAKTKINVDDVSEWTVNKGGDYEIRIKLHWKNSPRECGAYNIWLRLRKK
jgi:hypothetical protein